MLAVAASGCFTAGGLLMKPAAGLTRLAPSAAVFVLFVLGAACLARLVHLGGEVGPAYLVVVGLETVLAFALGAALFGEALTGTRLVAVALVFGGTAILAQSGAS